MALSELERSTPIHVGQRGAIIMKMRWVRWAAAVWLLGPSWVLGSQSVDVGHGISIRIPPGWDRVEGVLGTTVLKLARASEKGEKARITFAIDALAAGSIADPWSLTNAEIRKAAGESFMGEPVRVLDVGRSSIDGRHFIWSKTQRRIPGGPELWEFVYEGVRAADHFTIRLTVEGGEKWFSENQVLFGGIMQTVRLGPAKKSTAAYQAGAADERR